MKIIRFATLHHDYKFFPLKIVRIIKRPDPKGLSSLHRKISSPGWELLPYTHFMMLKKLPAPYWRTHISGIAFGGYFGYHGKIGSFFAEKYPKWYFKYGKAIERLFHRRRQ